MLLRSWGWGWGSRALRLPGGSQQNLVGRPGDGGEMPTGVGTRPAPASLAQTFLCEGAQTFRRLAGLWETWTSSCWLGGWSVGGSFPAPASRYSGSELRHCGAHTEPGTRAILNPAVLAAQMKTQRSGAKAWPARGGQFPGLGAQDGGRDPSLFGTVDTARGQMIEAVRLSETSRDYCGCETWFLPFGDRKSLTA